MFHLPRLPLAALLAAIVAACGGGGRDSSVGGQDSGVSTTQSSSDSSGSSAPTASALGVSLVGSGTVASSPSGISCGSQCSANFAVGAQVTLTAGAASGYTFTGWSGDGASCGTGSTCTLTLSASKSVSATFSTALASGTHPRIWLADTATMNRLKASAAGNSAEWSALKNFCDSQTTSSWDYQGQQSYRHVANFALCYRVTHALSGASAAAGYGQKAVNALKAAVSDNGGQSVLSFSNYSRDSGYGIRNFVPTLALAYDWLYDYSGLSAADKNAIASRIGGWLNWYKASGYCNVENNNCSPVKISNYHSGYMLASVLGGIALDGDSTAAPLSDGSALFTSAVGYFDSRLKGGHWPEGWNYGAGVYQRYLMAARALQLYTGNASYAGSSWLTDNVLFKMNALTPNGKFFYDDGAWTGDTVGTPNADDMMAAGFLYGWSSFNGHVAKAYLNLAGVGASNGEWTAFLFYDPASTPADLSAVAKSHYASGFGLVTMRSTWQTDTASSKGSWASLVSGPYLSGQGAQEPDAGHIELYRGSPLLINAGIQLYNPANQTNTSSKNTFTLENRTDTSYSGQAFALTFSCPNPNGNAPIGITRYHDSGTYAFTSGEFSAAYQTLSGGSCGGATGVSWLQRSLLYLRPDIVVMYDQVKKQSGQSTMVPTQHFHFPAQPAQVSGYRQLTMDATGGRLQFATVFPATSTSTVSHDSPNASTGPGIANYHLKVSYATQQDYQNFLTVLRTATTAYTYPSVTAVTGTNAYGTVLSGISASGYSGALVAVFADNRVLTVPTTLTYQHASTPGAAHYVALLKPSTSYGIVTSSSGGNFSVTITEGGATKVTDSAGLLAFTE